MTYLHRLNSLATFTGTVLAVACLAVTATDFVHTGEPLVTCEHVGTEGLQKEFGHDRAYVVLNLTADLRSEFAWNTKQLFVFVNVLFETPTNAVSEMVAWSSIVKDKEVAVMTLPALRPQYPYAITDQGFNLRGRQFNITVAWNVMPKVGALSKRVRTFAGFRMPVDYDNR